MTFTDIDWSLLERYLAEECTPEERAQVERWLAADPARRQRLALLRRTVAEEPALPAAADEWARFARRIQSAPAERATRWRWGSRWRHTGAKIAATLAVLVLGGIAARKFLVIGDRVVAPTPAPAMRVATTPRGQRAVFSLPDGSRVILAPASTLRHPTPFAAGPREVYLDGEAYFEVEHDERRPFRVHAGDLVAEDLGTQFVVRAYPDDKRAQVVVREGEVGIAGAVIRPGQLGRLDERGQAVVQAADTALHFAWTQGRLTFDAVPLAAALPQLSRWYDLEFRLADAALGRIPLTGTFTDRPTQETLELLAASLGLHAERRGQVVTFSRESRGH